MLLPRCLALLLLLVFVLPGCGDSNVNPKTSPGTGTGPSTATEPELPELKGEVKLEVASLEELSSTIASHKGKVVVVDYWSNWCDPCIREFPGLIKLQRQYPKDVVCISFNLNFDGIKGEPTDEQKDEALAFLKKKDAKILNFLSNLMDEKVYEQTGIVSVPAVIVYGKDGEIAKKFLDDAKVYGSKGFTYEKHIEPYVKSLVSAPSP